MVTCSGLPPACLCTHIEMCWCGTLQVAITTMRQEVPYVEQVRKGQMAISLPQLVTVDAQGYHLPDGFHLSTHAHCKLAREMAEAFLLNFREAPAAQAMDAPPVDDMEKIRAADP